MLRGVFVTGTDTGIGKTVISAALLVRYRSAAIVRYWKPIQTGIDRDDDTLAVSTLAGDAGRPPLNDGVRLPRSLSPHLAARYAGQTISLEPLLSLAASQSLNERFIVEGAGGVLVPINESALMVDFMRALGLPVLVIARSTLGTINHTLLTVEALRGRGLAVAGVIMNGPPNEDNREAIERYGRIEVLGQVPSFDHIGRDTVARMASLIDPEGRLLAQAFA
jgi:dethiobiotin synthase